MGGVKTSFGENFVAGKFFRNHRLRGGAFEDRISRRGRLRGANFECVCLSGHFFSRKRTFRGTVPLGAGPRRKSSGNGPRRKRSLWGPRPRIRALLGSASSNKCDSGDLLSGFGFFGDLRQVSDWRFLVLRSRKGLLSTLRCPACLGTAHLPCLVLPRHSPVRDPGSPIGVRRSMFSLFLPASITIVCILDGGDQRNLHSPKEVLFDETRTSFSQSCAVGTAIQASTLARACLRCSALAMDGSVRATTDWFRQGEN